MGKMDYDVYITKQRNDILKERTTSTTAPTEKVGAVLQQPLFCEKMDAVRPSHYGGADNPYEVFAVLEAWKLDKDFYLGNVIKYVARAGKKNPAKEKEDLQKALVYLRRRIDSL